MEFTFDTDTGLPTIGDMVPEGASILWYDGPDKTVTLIRQGGEIHIRTDWKNLQALLESNAREAAEFNASGSLGDFAKVASIPNGLFYDWSDEGVIDDPVALARRLNDPDYAKLRVNNIRI